MACQTDHLVAVAELVVIPQVQDHGLAVFADLGGSLKKHLHLSIMLLPDSAPVGKRGNFASVFPKIDLESASSNWSRVWQ